MLFISNDVPEADIGMHPKRRLIQRLDIKLNGGLSDALFCISLISIGVSCSKVKTSFGKERINKTSQGYGLFGTEDTLRGGLVHVL